MSGRPVVVGSGLAGLTTALALAPRECVLVTTGGLTTLAASTWAQGGVAAALGDDDSPALHAQDTLRAGAWAGDPRTVERITAAAPDVVSSLAALGVAFDRTEAGDLDLALEGGHSRHRVAHVGDASGAAVTSAVADAVRRAAHVELREHTRALRPVTDAAGAVRGLLVLDHSGREEVIHTDSVVLATGGLGGLFDHTTNPVTALGDGVALAARAGARTDDLHLVQFHPTALDTGRRPLPLLTEALRGAGAHLLADGARFVDELQPRDVVAAAVWEQLRLGREVVLDARAVPDVRRRFPRVAALVTDAGLRLDQDLLPARPAVHYAMGGVTTDSRSRTSVPGLWAVGETARTGLHGANRLASNSLLEAVVTGRAAATDVRAGAAQSHWCSTTPAADPSTVVPSTDGPAADLELVRHTLAEACGVLREAGALREAVAALEPLRDDDHGYVAWLIARSALAHPESIGAHRRTDVPALEATA